jgi:hypothetical protein
LFYNERTDPATSEFATVLTKDIST